MNYIVLYVFSTAIIYLFLQHILNYNLSPRKQLIISGLGALIMLIILITLQQQLTR